jgi:uncharacterized protein YeaO (DUF488 family)
VGVVVAPALELSERDEHELPAWDEFDHRLDAALEGVEAHAEARRSLLASHKKARDRL